jgi:hypothetical protein
MLEATVRKIHRTIGIYLVGFLAVQAITGLFIALGTLEGAPRDSLWLALMGGIHRDWNPIGGAYRILPATATVAQGIGGIIIYRLSRARTSPAARGKQA